jgi:hypothetical protein
MRRALLPAVATFVALCMGQPDTAASEPYRVEVNVVGTGSIRVRISEGHVIPCESLENRPVLTEWMAPGAPRVFFVSDDCICVEHTYGSFREAEWSVSTQYRYVPRRGQTERVIRVLLPTDHP